MPLPSSSPVLLTYIGDITMRSINTIRSGAGHHRKDTLFPEKGVSVPGGN
ncbi:MAG TPA: hypothetical protein PK154_01830 [Methanoregulaceae archaeon]|nr:hypothetical protein [Methanoregulaceae archaeon]HPW09833.1 hypothetical protein [Methanoregulaceae archaeon]